MSCSRWSSFTEHLVVGGKSKNGKFEIGQGFCPISNFSHSRRIPMMLTSSDRDRPPRNAETFEKQLATSSSGGSDDDAVAISINRDIPYSSSLLLRASGTPSVYKRTVSPLSSCKFPSENFWFGNMPKGSPVAVICSIFPPRLNSAGGWPALQIE